MYDIILYLSGVQHWTARRFTRRSYFSSGPNYLWHIAEYDKLKPYGLCIHGCICGFSRKILWLNVYKTNNNPCVVAGYFLDTVEKSGGTAYMVRGDFRTENVREMQRYFRGTTWLTFLEKVHKINELNAGGGICEGSTYSIGWICSRVYRKTKFSLGNS